MKWALAELNRFRDSQMDFKESIGLKESLQKREPSILNIEMVDVEGFIRVDSKSYVAHFSVQTTITLPSSRSLEPVLVPISLMLVEEYMTEAQLNALVDVNEDDRELIMPLEKDLIDLTDAVEDYILLNLPLQVLTEAEKLTTDFPKGDFWQVLSEEDLKAMKVEESENKIDPRLAKLSELFKDEE